MAEIYLLVSLTEGDGETISLVEVIADHTPPLPRNKKLSLSEDTLHSMVGRIMDRYDRQTWAQAKEKAREMVEGV